MSGSDTVLVALEGGVLRLTLNRPDKLNSFNEEMHLALRAGVQRAHDDAAVRAVLLTGAGRGFCAGQDLGDRDPRKATEAPDLGRTLDTLYNPTLRLIRSLEKPVICAVNGVAAGAGANIAFACDIVLAAKSARFIQAFSKIGLIPDTGGTWFLPQRVGMARAMGLALLADKLPAEKAAAWGLIWECVEDAEFAGRVETLAKQLSVMPTKALVRTRQAMHAAPGHTLEQQLSFEGGFMRELGWSADYAEGVQAFIEKRAPKFTGE